MILQMNYQDCPIFNPSELKGHGITISSFNHAGNMYDEFNLDHDYSLLLVSGYNVNLRMNSGLTRSYYIIANKYGSQLT